MKETQPLGFYKSLEKGLHNTCATVKLESARVRGETWCALFRVFLEKRLIDHYASKLGCSVFTYAIYHALSSQRREEKERKKFIKITLTP